MCGPEVPHRPPRRVARPVAQGPIEQYAASVAGSGAVDCGLGNDRASDASVYECGRQMISMNRPFYCRYDPWRSSHGDVISEEYELPSVAYARDRNGTLFLIQYKAIDKFESVPVAPTAGRMLRGMRPPRLLSEADRSVRVSGRHPTGAVIVETIIDANGSIADARILKPMSQSIDRAVLDALRKLKLEPARLFGLPRSVLFTTAVTVRQDALEFGFTRSSPTTSSLSPR